MKERVKTLMLTSIVRLLSSAELLTLAFLSAPRTAIVDTVLWPGALLLPVVTRAVLQRRPT
jgi:hypothetical protein